MCSDKMKKVAIKCDGSSVVERFLAKEEVAGSNPVYRSWAKYPPTNKLGEGKSRDRAMAARQVHALKVIGSSPVPAIIKSENYLR